FSLATAIFGGLTPAISTALVKLTGDKSSPGWWLMCAALCGLAVYTVRKRMSMLFQSGALFTDMNVFDNVAYPLREHTNLPAPLL
ncbi:hypothetical protein MJL79_30195, partial [Salmonella enterica subsp. enterica serovar Montevideo]|nr:hypothetical protein [Salmonella enterica subsp. enterica serovar Montevideo]